jgi:hypothetical protein
MSNNGARAHAITRVQRVDELSNILGVRVEARATRARHFNLQRPSHEIEFIL